MRKQPNPETFAAFANENAPVTKEEPMVEELEAGEEIFEEEIIAETGFKKPAGRQVQPANTVSPEVAAAHRIAAQHAQERAARDQARQARLAPKKDGRNRAPLQVRRQRYLPDHTRLPDGVTITPDWVPRWVRTYNEHGKESGMRTEEFVHYGYEPVRYSSGDNKGQVVKDALGLLMQGPPDGYMERAVHRSTDGVYDNSYFVDKQAEIVDGLNREMGVEAANLIVGKGHGTKRVASASDEDF